MFLYKSNNQNNIKPASLYKLSNLGIKSNLYKLTEKGDILTDIIQLSDYNIQSESFVITYELEDREVLQNIYVNNKLINETD